MDKRELERVLVQGEGLRIEVKEAQHGIPDTLYDTVSAFLNRRRFTGPLDLETFDAEPKNPNIRAFFNILTWPEKSGEVTNIRFLINNNLAVDELQKEGSWTEKSGKLLKKRARILLSVLLLTLIPMSLEELAGKLGFRSKERFRNDYIKSH